MIPVSLNKAKFSWEGHKSVLCWLGLLYRRPEAFRKGVENLSLRESIFVYFKIWLHSLPYISLLTITVSVILIFAILRLGSNDSLTSTSDILFSHINQVAKGIVFGIASGIVIGIVFGIIFGIAFGVTEWISGIISGILSGILFGILKGVQGVTEAEGITNGIAFGIIFGIASGIAIGIAFRVTEWISGIFNGIVLGIASGIVFAIPERIITNGIAGGIISGILSEIGFGIASAIVIGISSIISLLRIYYYPISFLFIWPSPKGRWYQYHPVAWDYQCLVPFPGLDRLLISFVECSSESGRKEIERLISGYPSQRMQALRAKAILLARDAGNVKDISVLSNIISQLPKGEKGFLNETPDIMEKVKEISNLQIRINTINRAILREPLARLLYKEIENFQHRIGGFHEPLVSEFRRSADSWLKIAKQQWEEAKAVTIKEPTPQVFRAGDPVDRNNEAFVPRYTVMGDLEKQVMLSTGCPGLVLYGRRRIGKSTLLRNLSGFLPGHILTVFSSMQNPEIFTSLEYFMQNITKDIDKVLSGKEPVAKVPSDLKDFFKYLSYCNHWLEKNDNRLLLSLDEYENIDLKIGQNVFPEDLLSTIRESIQTHRCITWIFAGSHEISELSHAPWTSYLVSARTIEIPMFTLDETRLLLTEPLKHSSLWNQGSSGRPHFDEKFWGEGGIEHIHKEAGGWPHLVQLVAETIVDLMNEEDTRQVDSKLMECALDKAIVSGHNVLYELIRRESALPGEWEYISAFRQNDVQPPPEEKAVCYSLRRRLLIREETGQWSLRVPLMRRWLHKRG